MHPFSSTNKPEFKLYGVNAARSVFARRPEAVIRAYLEHRLLDSFRSELKGLALRKRAYHLVEAAELEKITESAHHEGVCLIVEDELPLSPEQFIETLKPGAPCVLLALPDVGNPHNLGAITRTAAHFGVGAILLKDAGKLKSGAALRTASGGFEHVKVVEAESWEGALATLAQAGFELVATSSHAERDLYAAKFKPRTLFALGAEGEGLAEGWLEAAAQVLKIPGTGLVESLNVSVAAGVLLAEYFRQSRR